MRAEALPLWRETFNKFIGALRIQSKEASGGLDGKGIPLVLWGSQQRFLDEIATGLEQGVRRFVCLKSRQLGVTTVSLALDLFWLAMYPGTNGALVVHNSAAKEQFRQTLKNYIESFPPRFFGKSFGIRKGQDNREFLGFTNGSRLTFLVAGERDSEKETFGDGSGYSLVHLTEVAMYASVRALSSFEQTLSETNPDRLYIYESRANGMNHYRDTWESAGKDYFTWRRFFIGWWARADQAISRKDRRFPMFGLHMPNGDESELITIVKQLYNHQITPEQLAWYRWRCADLKTTIQVMNEQQPWWEQQAFVAAGFNYFGHKQLAEDAALASSDEHGGFQGYRYALGNDFFLTEIEQVEQIDLAHLRVWEDPVPGAQYVIGVDPAFGRNDNKDRHGIEVFRCYADCLDQVAEYADNECTAGQVAWILCHLAGNYADCIINVELTGGAGHLVMQELDHTRRLLRDESMQSRVVARGMDEFMASARWYLYHRPDSMGSGYVLNSQTNGTTKFPMMEQMRTCHRGGELIIRSVQLVNEMHSVRQDGTQVAAPGNNKDDRVIATALAIKAWKEWRQPTLIAQGMTYESQKRLEGGGAFTMGDFMNNVVRDFLKRSDSAAEEAPRAPQWMIERGLA